VSIGSAARSGGSIIAVGDMTTNPADAGKQTAHAG